MWGGKSGLAFGGVLGWMEGSGRTSSCGMLGESLG